MYLDIRMKEISYENAESFLKSLRGQSVYVKLINATRGNDDNGQQVGMYHEFDVKNVDTAFSQIVLFGKDEDKLFFDKDNIVSFQMTSEEDELLVILENQDVSSTIYIKKYLLKISERFEKILYSQRNTIITEGKTDWKHLKKAFSVLKNNGRYEDLDFSFIEYEGTMGCDELLKVCGYLSLFENEYLKVFILDSDRPEINREYEKGRFKYHGNNVYSMLLPIPDFRKDTPLISIENYYADNEIVRVDKNGRRLFLNGEFDNNGILKTDNRIKDINYVKHQDKGSNYIIDDKVIRCECSVNEIPPNELYRQKNIALSKSAFANYIFNAEPPFDSINHDTFSLVFDVIKEIQDSKATHIYEDLKRYSIEEEIIEPGIKLYKFKNDMFALTIDIEIPEFLKGRGRVSEYVAASLKYKEGHFIITVSYSGNSDQTIEIAVPCSDSIVSFFKEKTHNQYNRIELFMHDVDVVRSLELFGNPVSGALIERVLEGI